MENSLIYILLTYRNGEVKVETRDNLNVISTWSKSFVKEEDLERLTIYQNGFLPISHTRAEFIEQREKEHWEWYTKVYDIKLKY